MAPRLILALAFFGSHAGTRSSVLSKQSDVKCAEQTHELFISRGFTQTANSRQPRFSQTFFFWNSVVADSHSFP